eukprot:8048317-Pyramimonas_sp.AAC.1
MHDADRREMGAAWDPLAAGPLPAAFQKAPKPVRLGTQKLARVQNGRSELGQGRGRAPRHRAH